MDHEQDVNSESIPIVRCRELLGRDADGLSDVEVECIQQHADALAHVIIDIFLEQRSKQA